MIVMKLSINLQAYRMLYRSSKLMHKNSLTKTLKIFLNK